MRPQLWIYMATGENPNSKFKKWLRKMGEAPVLMSYVNPQATASVIDARLFNMGIFDSYTDFKSLKKIHSLGYLQQPCS